MKPPQPKGVAELSYAGSVKWDESTGADRYRRGLYIHFQRTVPYPQLMNFDAPAASLACTRRERTNTPLQALNLLNDPVFFEAAQGLAFRIMRESDRRLPRPPELRLRVTLGRAAHGARGRAHGQVFRRHQTQSRRTTRRPWPRSSPTAWKACRRPKPPPGWS